MNDDRYPGPATLRLPRASAPGRAGPPGASFAPGERLLWVALAWVLFAVLLFAGAGGFAGGLFTTIDDIAPGTTFAGDQTVEVTLDPEAHPAIYASADEPTDVKCQVGDGQDARIKLTRPTTSQRLSAGGTDWEPLFAVAVPAAGPYQVTCEGDGVTFGVGKELAAGAGPPAGGAAFLALPFLGLLAAVVVTVVVLARRAGARRMAR
ncbi:hypothetical protein [Microbispora sp. NPDC049125]|uniref:hypothetical protein n=1 Tax=Microbispora sp. NPDC049125 TaxID=3154929 RepID=UPI003466918E